MILKFIAHYPKPYYPITFATPHNFDSPFVFHQFSISLKLKRDFRDIIYLHIPCATHTYAKNWNLNNNSLNSIHGRCALYSPGRSPPHWACKCAYIFSLKAKSYFD